MAHPNELRLRQLYADFSRGDLDAVLAACADDVVFHVPGRNQLAGDHPRGDFHAFIGKVMALSGGTFREELRDVLANDDHGVALLFHRLERDGEPFEYRTVHVWRIRDGQLTGWWEHPHETIVFDAAWS